jgi:hypothetical protein
VADLDRVRKALALLSDDPAAASGQTAAHDDGPVPSSSAPSPTGVLVIEGGDEADTAPLPVILPGVTSVPPPEQPDMPRGPFEPAHATSPAAVAVPEPLDAAVPAADPAVAPEATFIPPEVAPAEAVDQLPVAAAEKLDQIKDLLITAEAIGEANLDRHFERVSQRQRELIREFFDRAMPGREPGA